MDRGPLQQVEAERVKSIVTRRNHKKRCRRPVGDINLAPESCRSDPSLAGSSNTTTPLPQPISPFNSDLFAAFSFDPEPTELFPADVSAVQETGFEGLSLEASNDAFFGNFPLESGPNDDIDIDNMGVSFPLMHDRQTIQYGEPPLMQLRSDQDCVCSDTEAFLMAQYTDEVLYLQFPFYHTRMAGQRGGCWLNALMFSSKTVRMSAFLLSRRYLYARDLAGAPSPEEHRAESAKLLDGLVVEL